MADRDTTRGRKVWLITGTSSGLGRALAEEVLAHGDRLVATARHLSAIADLAAHSGAVAARLDVTDGASIRSAVAASERAFGRIDVLVNNAGCSLLGAFEGLTDEQLHAQFETNVFGAMAVTRAVLPLMRARRQGHIVQMSSVNGVVHGAGGVAYVGSKYALEGMSASLAAEVAHLGIGVTIVEPGAFRTDFGRRSLTWGESLADYEPIIAPARKAFEASHGSQPGDPRRAARAIIAALELEHPPPRLPLGADAFISIRAHLRARLADLDAMEVLGADTAYP